MNVHQSAITLVAALVVMDGNFQQVSAKAQANHCGDHIGFGPAPCLDTNIVANEFTAFMHNECVNGASPTLCDQYNPVWGQVHSSYQNSGDSGCDLSSDCQNLLYVHPVFDTFDEGSTEHKITSFTHCTEDECALDAADAAAALNCWNIFSSCFPNKIDDYHVVVEPGTTFDDASKLKEYYIYTSLPFAGSKAKDPKCDACTDCYDACQTSIDDDGIIDQSYDTKEDEEDEDEYLSSSSSSFVEYTHYSFMVTVAAAVYGYQYYA